MSELTPPRTLALLVRVGGRCVFWALVLLLLGRGTLEIAAGLRPAAEQLVGKPRASMQVREREAAAFATGFARAYLSFSPAHPERHAAALKPYASSWLGEHAGIELSTGGSAQRVVGAEPARVLRLDRSHLFVTVAVELAPPRAAPIYLTVPISGSPGGALAVVDYPSFSPPPRRAALREPDHEPLDSRARPQIEDLLRRFFPIYLSGRSDELAYFLPPGRTLDALSTHYDFVDLTTLEGSESDRSGQPVVLAEIRVRDQQTRATYLLRYRLKLELRGRWYVAAINTV
jgi:conjugative transposon protein TcpC